jgi:hypothetical protein
MSLWSDPFSFRLHNKPAVVYVVRNNGECWGRIVTEGGTEYDVSTRKDWYDQEDLSAAMAFANRARGEHLDPPAGWTGQAFVPADECEGAV